jgi:hypothetical protein
MKEKKGEVEGRGIGRGGKKREEATSRGKRNMKRQMERVEEEEIGRGGRI